MIVIIVTFAVGFFALALDRLLKEYGPEGAAFPRCLYDKTLMVKVPVGRRDMPEKIRQYLVRWNLSEVVIQRYMCQKCGRELWIAPQVGDMEKNLFVGRKA
jgi:hypothetical protein